MSNSSIHEYIRNKYNEKIGLLYGEKYKDIIYISYSLTCKSDKFNKDRAFEIAQNRINKQIENPNWKLEFPKYTAVEQLEKFKDRCERYFKCKIQDVLKINEDSIIHGVLCHYCKEFIISRATHDFVTCSCGNEFIDGGREYTRCKEGAKIYRIDLEKAGLMLKDFYNDYATCKNKLYRLPYKKYKDCLV